MRALAIVDGEHYAPVVRDALAELPYDVVAAVLIGGTEKLRGGEDYGVPLVTGLDEGIAEYRPELVLDLSDEPVLKEYVEAFGRLLRVAQKPSACMRDGGDAQHVFYTRLVNW